MMLTAGVGYHGVLVQRKTFEKRHDYDCSPETIPGPTAPGILNWHSFTLRKVAGTDNCRTVQQPRLQQNAGASGYSPQK